MNAESSAGLIEMAFTYSVAIGFGVWQVVKTRRQLARDRQEKAAAKVRKENET
ncbi:MAG: hypothetical protein JSS20_01430 [Proteobacteria bacterium]|nr:hypothetical protein [Pseudomonadota bacterium]